MAPVTRPLGIFENLPIDNFRQILEKFNYIDLAALAETSDSMRKVIREELSTKGFLSRWVARQAVEDQKVDCYEGAGKLIWTTCGGGDEGVGALKTLLEEGYVEATRSFEGVGAMVGAYLDAAQNELTKDLAADVFRIVWNLGGYWHTTVLTLFSHLETIVNFEAIHEEQEEEEEDVDDDDDDDDDEEETWEQKRKQYEASHWDIYMLCENVRNTFVVEKRTSSRVRRLLLAELFWNVHRTLEADTDRIAIFVATLLLQPTENGDEFKQSALAVELFGALISSAPDAQELKVVSDVFRKIFDESVSGEEWSALLAHEPNLLHLFLYDQSTWVVFQQKTAQIIFNALLKMSESNLLNEQMLIEFGCSVRAAKEHNETKENGAGHLLALCQEVLALLAQHKNRGHSVAENPFFNAFFKIGM